MAGAAVREAVMLAGRAKRARVARGFVGGVLGPGYPCGEIAVLLVSELFANSVRHSGSGAPGETVTVAVRGRDGVIRVEVTDRSGPGCRNSVRPAVRRTAAGDLGWWRGWLRGGVAAAWRADGDLVRACGMTGLRPAGHGTGSEVQAPAGADGKSQAVRYSIPEWAIRVPFRTIVYSFTSDNT
jgi:hypothetical protein